MKKPSVAPGNTAIPPRGVLSGPHIRNHFSSPSRCAADLLLVFGAMAMALGLAAVTASLTLFPEVMADPGQNRVRIDRDRDVALTARPPIAGNDLVQPLVTPLNLTREPALSPLSHVNVTGHWRSPLYPQNGVTVWDRIRVSTQRDRRAFLLGVAIQVHARAAAASPGNNLPPCCPRS